MKVTGQEREKEAPERAVGVALSGGGHRACLFGLGALLYLIDAGKGPSIAMVSSVSGGSLANGAIAQSVDLTRLRPGQLDPVASRVAGRITGSGTVLRSPVTIAYGALLIGLLLLALAPLCPWLFSLSLPLRALLFAVGAFVLGWAATWRGRVCARAFDRSLFRPQGSSTRLESVCDELDHVFCATDLHAGEHVYFSARFVYSHRFGRGVPGDVRLSDVVQASAAFPGVFPISWLPTARHEFKNPGQKEAAETRRMALVDGGVYDNMADQWAESLYERRSRRPDLPSSFRVADEMVVVNASAGLDWKPLRGARVPLIGELLALLRDKSVLYDNGNSLRRRALVKRFKLAAKDKTEMRGALVHIPQSPFKIPNEFSGDWNPHAGRARAARDALARGKDPVAEEKRWTGIAKANSAVPTTLVSFSPETSAQLMHHAYVLAMTNLHTILGYPLLDLPDKARFEAIARGEAG